MSPLEAPSQSSTVGGPSLICRSSFHCCVLLCPNTACFICFMFPEFNFHTIIVLEAINNFCQASHRIADVHPLYPCFAEELHEIASIEDLAWILCANALALISPVVR